MKKILLSYLFLATSMFQSQTLSEVKEYSKSIGGTIESFEIKYKKTAVEKKSNFGIETKAYKFEKYVVILDGDDTSIIQKVSLLPIDYKTSNMIWYDNVKEIRSQNDFKFVKSFLNDEKTNFFSGDMKYIELIDKLREINDVERIEVEVVFKKDGTYYSYLLIKNKLSIQISNSSNLE